jgi:hypothetical protein
MSRKRIELPRRAEALRTAKARFREIFPRAFADKTYLAWERDYKWEAHKEFARVLGRAEFERLLNAGEHQELALRLERFYAQSHLNMLALFEWMALREALRDRDGARLIMTGMHDLLWGDAPFGERLERFAQALDAAPQRQTRIAKWPVVTLWPFIAQPKQHMILKPKLVKTIADAFGFDLHYQSRPNALTYAAFIDFARTIQRELAAWKPRDLIDVQSFLWATHSEEYASWPWD